MAFSKMIKIAGFRYDTRPKMGTNNVMYGVFLNDTKKTKPKKRGKSSGKKRS